MSSDNIARVVPFRPIHGLWEYQVPSHLSGSIEPGSICVVPLQGTDERGIVVELSSTPQFDGELSSIKSVDYHRPLPTELIELAYWIKAQTYTPLGQIFRRMIPRNLNSVPRSSKTWEINRSISDIFQRINSLRGRAPKQRAILDYLLSVDRPVTKQQILAEVDCSSSPFKSLLKKGLLQENEGEGFDVYSATLTSVQPRQETSFSGSVESEYNLKSLAGPIDRRWSFYLQLLESLAPEKQVIVLVPTIHRGLQLSNWFKNYSKMSTTCFHSKLSLGGKAARWRQFWDGELDVAVGPEGAMYLPPADLGALIVDGEADGSFKMMPQSPRIDSLQVINQLAQIHNTPLYLSDAIPSVNSYYTTQIQEKGSLDVLGGQTSTHGVTIAKNPPGSSLVLATETKNMLREALDHNNSALLIGGSKGSAPAIVCTNCGKVLRCPDCGVPLIYRTHGELATCPYCGVSETPNRCPRCGNEDLSFIPGGIEKIAQEVRDNFPGAEVAQISGEQVSVSRYHHLVEKLRQNKIDLLVGTRVAADFLTAGRVGLVGLLSVDRQLSRPNFRASETALVQLYRMTTGLEQQFSVVVQTSRPDHEVIQTLLADKWKAFYQQELTSRKAFSYPPFASLVTIELTGESEESINKHATELQPELDSQQGVLDTLGPITKHASSSNKKNRVQIIIKTTEVPAVASLVEDWTPLPSGEEISIAVEY